MNDMEIIKWLTELKPESPGQKKKINEAVIIFYENHNEYEFLKTLEYSEVEGTAVSSVYDRYADWCRKNKFTPITKIKFSKLVMQEFGVISVTGYNKCKPLKVYKMI